MEERKSFHRFGFQYITRNPVLYPWVSLYDSDSISVEDCARMNSGEKQGAYIIAVWKVRYKNKFIPNRY